MSTWRQHNKSKVALRSSNKSKIRMLKTKRKNKKRVLIVVPLRDLPLRTTKQPNKIAKDPFLCLGPHLSLSVVDQINTNSGVNGQSLQRHPENIQICKSNNYPKRPTPITFKMAPLLQTYWTWKFFHKLTKYDNFLPILIQNIQKGENICLWVLHDCYNLDILLPGFFERDWISFGQLS